MLMLPSNATYQYYLIMLPANATCQYYQPMLMLAANATRKDDAEGHHMTWNLKRAKQKRLNLIKYATI